MTDADFRNQVAKLAAEAPRAVKLPQRTALDIEIDRLTWYLKMSASSEAKMRYASLLLAARKRRGDDLSGKPVEDLAAGAEAIATAKRQIVQTEGSERARALEALRERADLPGERHD